MKIIIAGAGNVGTHLAKLLSREKQDIILMDDDEEKLSALSANFDLLTVAASPSSISGLKEVGVKEADLFIAVTPDESRNMTACMLATNLGAKKTVARIDNYEYLCGSNGIEKFFCKSGRKTETFIVRNDGFFTTDLRQNFSKYATLCHDMRSYCICEKWLKYALRKHLCGFRENAGYKSKI